MRIVECQADQVAAILAFEPDHGARRQVLPDLYQFIAKCPKVALDETLFFLVAEAEDGVFGQFGRFRLESGGER